MLEKSVLSLEGFASLRAQASLALLGTGVKMEGRLHLALLDSAERVRAHDTDERKRARDTD